MTELPATVVSWDLSLWCPACRTRGSRRVHNTPGLALQVAHDCGESGWRLAWVPATPPVTDHPPL